MRIGVTFPQTEIGADPAGVRAYAEAAQEIGYSHLLAYDHVVGADVTNRPNWRGPYTSKTMFHEPFVLFGFLAAVAPRLELVTNVIILPQRQTALVAKQAAEIDVLTGGKFRLGVGIGWNQVEYEALNENFGSRGARSEEQVRVLRRLFSEESVTFQGTWHHLDAVGINPLPVQRSIPIWLGGMVDATLRRVAALGDGWFPQGPPDHAMRDMLKRLRTYIEEEGRDPATIGIEARIGVAGGTPADWRATLETWRDLGATHIGVNTMAAGFESPQEHIHALRRFWEEAAHDFAQPVG